MLVTLLNFLSTASSGDGGCRGCDWGFLFRGLLEGWADGCVGAREKEGVTGRGCGCRRIDFGSTTGCGLVFAESSTALFANDTVLVVSDGVSKHCVHGEKETRFVLTVVDEGFCRAFRHFQTKDQKRADFLCRWSLSGLALTVQFDGVKRQCPYSRCRLP